jgi:hypothetical protein
MQLDLEANTVRLSSEEFVNYAMFFRRDALVCSGTNCPEGSSGNLTASISALLVVFIIVLLCFAVFAGIKALYELKKRKDGKKNDEEGSYQPVVFSSDE